MTLRIRLSRPDDAAHLPAIERSAAARFRSVPALAWIADDAVMSAEGHAPYIAAATSWVACDEAGGLLGFLAAQPFGTTLHIWELAVRAEHQGRGIGRRLVAAACEAAQARGLADVTLTTFRELPWNEPFYKRCGFETLDSAGLDARLRAVRDHEAALGLPVERRCAMRWRPSAPAPGSPG